MTTFQIIEGGKGRPSIHEAQSMAGLSSIERARCEVIDRLAAAAWEVEREPHEINWAAYVRRGYDEADKSPGILVDVSNRYTRARAMLLALKPPEPCFDEDIAVAVSCDVNGSDPVVVVDHVSAWIDEVLK